MTYKNCKKIIESGNYNKDVMMNMLDTFLMRERITIDEYNELIELMG